MQRINAALAEIDAGPDDLALCQAAAGGDLLFLEAALARGVRCRVLLPFDQAQFIAESILPASDGPRWRSRFFDGEEIEVTVGADGKSQKGRFVDAGVSPHNNPSLQLLLLDGHRLNWATGADELLLVSLDTGRSEIRPRPDPEGLFNFDIAGGHAMMSYARDDAVFDRNWLADEMPLDYATARVQRLCAMGEPGNMTEQSIIGRAVGSRLVKESHFPQRFNQGAFAA